MGNLFYFVPILVFMVTFNFIEGIKDKNINRINPIASDILDRKLEGCLTRQWGCLGLPSGCIQTKSCKMLATYHAAKSSGDIKFSLTGNVDIKEYLAIGISTDDKMGDDGVVFCYNEHPNIGISWNWKGDYQKGSTIIDNNNVILNNRYHTYVDNWLFCEFTLMKETRITIPTQGRKSRRIEYLHLDQPYYLQLANGGIANGQLGYHGPNNKITTQEEIYLSSTIAYSILVLCFGIKIKIKRFILVVLVVS